MSDHDAISALVCWAVSIPLQVWGGLLGGPTSAYVAAMATFVIGLVLFTKWAMAGGMPRMYRH